MFRIIAPSLIIIISVILLLFVYKFNSERKPLITENFNNAVCCSEETTISIIEGIEPLKETYEKVVKAINNKDSVNQNALYVKKIWEDSLKKQ